MYDSLLSEFAVLGFDYGYSVDHPQALVSWEAQFGDFSNGAQVIVDQFLISAEEKWNQTSGLVLLLPHGYEGQGPEHSSARLERFLTLAARKNIRIANPTTPAQYFHLLRLQARHPERKPLIVMTPKSLLRHPQAVSPRNDFTSGRFRELLDDPRDLRPADVDRLVLCSGKIYYDLAKMNAECARTAIAPRKSRSTWVRGTSSTGAYGRCWNPSRHSRASHARGPEAPRRVRSADTPRSNGRSSNRP